METRAREAGEDSPCLAQRVQAEPPARQQLQRLGPLEREPELMQGQPQPAGEQWQPARRAWPSLLEQRWRPGRRRPLNK